MAIGRISGPMLFSNLDRQGVDLAFQSNLLYLDVNNLRVGVLNDTPQYVLDSSGNVKLANIVILGNTITSNTGVINLGSTSNIVITGGSSNNVLYTDGLGNLRWGQISELDISWDNFTVTTGNAAVWYATELNSTTANITSATVTNFNTSNIIISGGNVTANLTGNISGTNANFTGNVDADWFVGNIQAATGNFDTVNATANVTLSGTLTATGNLVAQKITSSTGDLHISAATNNPNNIIRFDSVSAFDIPSGTTAERPPSPDYGYVRYNTDIGSIEWWGGSQWVAGSNLISTQQITPDGSNNTFTLNQSTVENAILVNINGTIQQAGAGAYSVSGNQITFAEVPLITDIIEIRFLASGVAALTINFANIAGNVSPSANVTYDLGSPNYRWRDLWLSGNTINLGSASLSAVGNTIQLPAGSTVGGASVDVAAIDANIAAVRANVVAANAAIISANTAMKTYVDAGLADALFAASSYGNATVAAYLPADTTVTTIQSNIGAFYNYANTKLGTNSDSNLVIQATTVSSSTTTGALVVRGGLGVAGNISCADIFVRDSNPVIRLENSSGANGGSISFKGTFSGTNVTLGAISTVDSTSSLKGAFYLMKGYAGETTTTFAFVPTGADPGVTGMSSIAVAIRAKDTVAANTSHGTMNITGGLGVSLGATIGGNIVAVSDTSSTSTTTGALVVVGGVGISGNLYATGNIVLGSNTTSNLVVAATTPSTSTTTGALVVQGGVGIAANLNVGAGSGNAIVANGNVVVNGNLLIGGGVGGGVIPPGGIIMWSGSEASIPIGWLLCNGSNGTPDLRNRFVVGAGTGSSYAVGATGGSANAVVVSHTHTATVSDPGHFHNSPTGDEFKYYGNSGIVGNGPSGLRTTDTLGITQTKTTGISVSNSTEGVSGTNANLPPYYALCYIMKS